MATTNFSLSTYIVRHTFLTRAVLIFSGSLLLLLLAIVPMFRNVREMSSSISKKQEEVNELVDKVTVLSGIDQNVLDLRVRILDNALPPRKDVIIYLTSVDGLSRELNLNFGGISLSPGTVTEEIEQKNKTSEIGLQTLDTEIQIRGSKDNIYSFLRLIEQTTPLMQIKDVKVVRTSDSEDQDSYNLSLSLGMLWASSNLDTIKGKIVLFDEKEEKFFQELNQFKRYEANNLAITSTEGLGKLDLFTSLNETE